MQKRRSLSDYMQFCVEDCF